MIIRIRRINEDDRNNLSHFFREVITHTFIKEGAEDAVDTMEEEIKDKIDFIDWDFKTEGKERFFLLATVNNEIVGTVGYGPAGSLISEGSGGELEGINEVGSVFVLPSHQQKGIGSMLLNAMYLALLGKGIKEFTLDSGYPTAQKVWCKKFGEPTYLMKDKWGEGFDHFIWYVKMKDVEIKYRLDSVHV